jgi:hypothetical protein
MACLILPEIGNHYYIPQEESAEISFADRHYPGDQMRPAFSRHSSDFLSEFLGVL